MDLTPGRQRLVFVVIVIALVGLTSYLIESRHSGAAPAPSARPPSPAGTQGSGVPPSSVPAVTPVPTASGAEIYQWLPFTAADLSAAAQTTLTFAKDYSTWSYKESVTDYAAKLSPLVTTSELATLKSGYSTAGGGGGGGRSRRSGCPPGAGRSTRSVRSAPVLSRSRSWSPSTSRSPPRSRPRRRHRSTTPSRSSPRPAPRRST